MFSEADLIRHICDLKRRVQAVDADLGVLGKHAGSTALVRIGRAQGLLRAADATLTEALKRPLAPTIVEHATPAASEACQ